MSNNVSWICENDSVEIIAISKGGDMFGIEFPRDYVECIMKNDGGYPRPNRFNLNGNEEVFNNLLSFDEEDSSNIMEAYNDVKDRLIRKVIPFAEDPFGNLICFDYRDSEQPIIVFWEHEKAFNDKESAMSYLCDSFTDLLSMLHESQE
ncbi:SMI1/KNR4 family protein [Clostridium estertheticum]|uniref:SMI1/KNR4 family protein n=1 Tax=Clostridium estertheticum TaxID=238834 RepID=UPI001C6E15D7|nr:SMI1/KNR4 family protein [Clostridium estertheticum]MBW9154791.1 SMI1/KNR4 family protein [Clostridium estertheticum]WLC82520.1 SMI1/KNR4 family protein [Clostridium estertheticum]